MVRVMGNSPERVEVLDLHDVIYYKQLKEFTDQEFENSKDLKKEIGKGRVIKLEQKEVSQGSGEISAHQWIEPPKSLNINDLKNALREVLPELKGGGVSESSIKSSIRDLAPLIVDMVRQEVKNIGFIKQEVRSETVARKKYLEPVYVPTISDAGLKSNITAKKQEVSNDSMSDALKALKDFKNK